MIVFSKEKSKKNKKIKKNLVDRLPPVFQDVDVVLTRATLVVSRKDTPFSRYRLPYCAKRTKVEAKEKKERGSGRKGRVRGHTSDQKYKVEPKRLCVPFDITVLLLYPIRMASTCRFVIYVCFITRRI